MFHSKKFNNGFNSTYKRDLRPVSRNSKATFNDLLGKDKFEIVHGKILRLLATEKFELRNDLAPDIMKEIFHFTKPTHNLGSDTNTFSSRKIRTTYQG